MMRYLDMYLSWMRMHLANTLQYRAMIAMWQVAGLVEVAVALAVWSAVAAAQGGMVEGWTEAQLVAYFVVVMLVNELTHTWTIWMWAWRVDQGVFGTRLLRPAPPILEEFADNAAVKVLSMSIKIPLAILVAWQFGADFTTGWVDAVLLVPALCLAWAIRGLVEGILACGAFWLVRVSALVNGYHVVFLLLSGTFAPIALMPDWIRVLASALPFRWIVEFPAMLAMGQLDTGEALAGLAIQAAWLAASWLGFRIAWRVTLNHYNAAGA